MGRITPYITAPSENLPLSGEAGSSQHRMFFRFNKLSQISVWMESTFIEA